MSESEEGIIDAEAREAKRRYAEVAKRLNRYDGVLAIIDESGARAPMLEVRARRGYGGPTSALRVLARNFDAEDLFAAPARAKDGSPLLVLRAKVGGYDR